MTINELDQGIRNLISSQPMVSAGTNGEVIHGISSLIDAYRNLCYRIQSYPCQDVMKFGVSNEVAKMESVFTNLACQVLQERGINLMLYVPRTGGGYSPMVNGYGMINTAPNQNMMAGQMMYSPMGQYPVMPMPNSMYQQGRPQQVYPQSQPMMGGLGAQNYVNRQMPMQPASSIFPGAANKSAKVIKPAEKKPDEPVIEKLVPAPEPEQEVEKPVPENQKIEQKPVEKPKVNVADMLMGNDTGADDKKAKGRDYLLELLKK